ncbi:MAG: dTDP-4-dehydrorhamnose reductase, partial [Mailhella sp.]|nr:dTDP-4-dehydrorhamnose reductase [Mailhella sp.]
MKVFVTGVNGLLGHNVMNELAGRGHQVLGSDLPPAHGGKQDGTALQPYAQLDITDAAAVRTVLEAFRPDAVVHCAAWTAVDAAEEPQNRERVFAVNAAGTRHVAQACGKLGCKMLYVSTDYVFDGQGSDPWQPDSEAFAPMNVYGLSKLEGERAVRDLLDRFFIVRTAWLFGANGPNFVRAMLRLADAHDTLRVVSDQIGTPTCAFDLARLLADMIETERYGTWHAANEGGFISRAGFAEEIFRQEAERKGLPAPRCRVIPVTTAEYGLS